MTHTKSYNCDTLHGSAVIAEEELDEESQAWQRRIEAQNQEVVLTKNEYTLCTINMFSQVVDANNAAAAMQLQFEQSELKRTESVAHAEVSHKRLTAAEVLTC